MKINVPIKMKANKESQLEQDMLRQWLEYWDRVKVHIMGLHLVKIYILGHGKWQKGEIIPGPQGIIPAYITVIFVFFICTCTLSVTKECKWPGLLRLLFNWKKHKSKKHISTKI